MSWFHVKSKPGLDSEFFFSVWVSRDMDFGISDELLGTFAPIFVYWIYSGIYVVLGLFSDNYRLHSKKDEDEKNLVSKFSVVKGVLLQQIVQAVVAIVLFAVSGWKLLKLSDSSVNYLLDFVGIFGSYLAYISLLPC